MGLASLAAPAIADGPAPTLSVSAPNTVHVGKTYRVHASGTAPQHALALAVFIQTDWKCKKQPQGESNHGAYPAISPYGPVPVGPGSFKKRSDKLEDTKANGHDYVCGYLMRRTQNGFVVLKRASKRIASKS